jgi:hypothetical protein
MAGGALESTVLGMLTPKVICLTSLPSAHGSRSQSGAVSAASSAAKR